MPRRPLPQLIKSSLEESAAVTNSAMPHPLWSHFRVPEGEAVGGTLSPVFSISPPPTYRLQRHCGTLLEGEQQVVIDRGGERAFPVC